MDEVEVEKEARVMKCFYHPNASFRTFWDFMQVFLLMYHIQSTLPSALSSADSVLRGGKALPTSAFC